MKRIYLRIIDIDQFHTAEIADEKAATHCIDIEDEDFDSVMNFMWRYLNKITPYLPMHPEALSPEDARG